MYSEMADRRQDQSGFSTKRMRSSSNRGHESGFDNDKRSSYQEGSQKRQRSWSRSKSLSPPDNDGWGVPEPRAHPPSQPRQGQYQASTSNSRDFRRRPDPPPTDDDDWGTLPPAASSSSSAGFSGRADSNGSARNSLPSWPAAEHRKERGAELSNRYEDSRSSMATRQATDYRSETREEPSERYEAPPRASRLQNKSRADNIPKTPAVTTRGHSKRQKSPSPARSISPAADPTLFDEAPEAEDNPLTMPEDIAAAFSLLKAQWHEEQDTARNEWVEQLNEALLVERKAWMDTVQAEAIKEREKWMTEIREMELKRRATLMEDLKEEMKRECLAAQAKYRTDMKEEYSKAHAVVIQGLANSVREEIRREADRIVQPVKSSLFKMAEGEAKRIANTAFEAKIIEHEQKFAAAWDQEMAAFEIGKQQHHFQASPAHSGSHGQRSPQQISHSGKSPLGRLEQGQHQSGTRGSSHSRSGRSSPTDAPGGALKTKDSRDRSAAAKDGSTAPTSSSSSSMQQKRLENTPTESNSRRSKAPAPPKESKPFSEFIGDDWRSYIYESTKYYFNTQIFKFETHIMDKVEKRLGGNGVINRRRSSAVMDPKNAKSPRREIEDSSKSEDKAEGTAEDKAEVNAEKMDEDKAKDKTEKKDEGLGEDNTEDQPVKDQNEGEEKPEGEKPEVDDQDRDLDQDQDRGENQGENQDEDQGERKSAGRQDRGQG